MFVSPLLALGPGDGGSGEQSASGGEAKNEIAAVHMLTEILYD
jgi:hypothetical protein